MAPAPGISWGTLAGNVFRFQAGWFACVLGAAHGMDGIADAMALALVLWHVARSASWRAQLALLAAVVAVGAAWDSAMGLTGWLVLRRGWPDAWPAMLAPAWILALWALFGTTLDVSLRWLRGRAWTGAALGAIFGPLSYWGGARLGAGALVQPVPAVALMAAGWALLTPLLVALAGRIEARTAGHADGPGGGRTSARNLADGAAQKASGAGADVAAGRAATTPGGAAQPKAEAKPTAEAQTRGPT